MNDLSSKSKDELRKMRTEYIGEIYQELNLNMHETARQKTIAVYQINEELKKRVEKGEQFYLTQHVIDPDTGQHYPRGMRFKFDYAEIDENGHTLFWAQGNDSSAVFDTLELIVE